MSDGDTNVRVRLDTTQAKAEMDALNRRGQKTAEGISGRTRGSALAAAGGGLLGSLAGSAIGSVRGSVGSGAQDVFSETFGVYQRQLEGWAFGNLKDEASAAEQARADTARAFGHVIGTTESIPNDAVTYFEGMKKYYETRNRGERLLGEDSRFGGTGMNDTIREVSKDAANTVVTGVLNGLRGTLMSVQSLFNGR